MTRRQREIACLILEGFRNKGIAALLGISLQTVKNVTGTIYDKLGADNRVDLILRYADRLRVLS